MSEINVTVVNFNRRYWYMRYVDPLTGKVVAKSSGTENKKEALKIAAKWEAELQEGRYKSPSKVSWTEFRHRYEDEVLTTLAPKTAKKICGVFNSIESLINPDKLAKLNADQLSRFQKLLRSERKQAEITIKHNLAHLMAALKWAKRVGLLNEVPTIEIPKRAVGSKIMKGRPVTAEEFERMLGKVPEILNKMYSSKPGDPETEASKPAPTPAEVERRADLVHRWQWFLRGLWFSGLRLGEALDLSWDESGHIEADLSGEYAMFHIPAARQKSGKDQLLPIAPEFAEQLKSVSPDQRTGPVFKLGRRDVNGRMGLLIVSKAVSAIGESAGVIVNQKPLKFASAHDFRRSFGERWSTRVMPATLQAMMRHADISTTMKFYVGQNGQKAAADIYAAFSRNISAGVNTSLNTGHIDAGSREVNSTQPTEMQ